MWKSCVICGYIVSCVKTPSLWKVQQVRGLEKKHVFIWFSVFLTEWKSEQFKRNDWYRTLFSVLRYLFTLSHTRVFLFRFCIATPFDRPECPAEHRRSQASFQRRTAPQSEADNFPSEYHVTSFWEPFPGFSMNSFVQRNNITENNGMLELILRSFCISPPFFMGWEFSDFFCTINVFMKF